MNRKSNIYQIEFNQRLKLIYLELENRYQDILIIFIKK